MRTWVSLSLLLVACQSSETTATVQSPPLVVSQPPSQSQSQSQPPTPPLSPSQPLPQPQSPTLPQAQVASPVEARFVDATSTPVSLPVPSCHQLFVAAVKGTVTAGGQSLSAGDVLATTSGPVELRGAGTAVVATTAVTPCSVPLRLVLASSAPELTFMGGAMHAHLDLDDRTVAPTAYLGRLAGTAPVSEHAHDKSWEVLCAVEAAGTFTLAGQPQRVGPRTCVYVPPGTKHSWQPDPGSTLSAVQLYSPPGPEQRFKKLAAEPPK
jgi:mannose-6-phosphate isomerase-like protein (cupin superfamily)